MGSERESDPLRQCVKSGATLELNQHCQCFDTKVQGQAPRWWDSLVGRTNRAAESIAQALQVHVYTTVHEAAGHVC